MPGKIAHLKTRNDLKEFMNKSNAFIIDVTATWCGPCKALKPYLEQYFEQIKDKFDMVIVDEKEGADIVSFLKVNSFPTLISYVNKERAEALVGFDIEGLKHFLLQSYERAVHN